MKFKHISDAGLTVKNGRLVNNRPDGISGIQQAANIKRTMDRSRKVDMIADGVNLAEGKKYFYRL